MNFEDLQETYHIKDYLSLLRRRRDIILAFFITTVAIVTLGVLIMKPVYRASATLLVDLESPNMLTTSGAVELGAPSYNSYYDYLQTQMEIMTTRSIARQVIDDLHLKNLKAYAQSKDPVEALLKSVSVEPKRDTRLVVLNVDSEDPVLAAKIANRLAEVYVRRNLVYISKSEQLNLSKNEYLKLQSRLSEYAKVYKENHPAMIKLRKEIADLVRNMGQGKKESFVYGAEEKADAGSGEIALEGLKANNVSITEPAEVPLKPVKPKKRLAVLLAMVFGALGGIGLAFFLEYLDDSVKTVDEAEKITQWPLLGNVPDIDGDMKLSEQEKGVFMKLASRCPASEAYRSFRTNVLCSATEEHPVKSVVVSSPGQGEGKTLTLCNLGIALANSRKSVLLIDADMRKPRLHEIFRCSNGQGLSSFLSGQTSWEGLEKRTDIEHLSVIPSGPVPPNPSELLASRKLQELIQNASSKYDFVILDTPPMAILTDAVLVGRVCHGLVMVLQSGKTSKRALVRMTKNVRESKLRILGILLNKVPLSSDIFNSYTSYYHQPTKQ